MIKSFKLPQLVKLNQKLGLFIISIAFSFNSVKAQQTIEYFKVQYAAVPHVTELENIYFLDVFGYYNITGYSDLKKEVFKQSDDYKTKLNALKEKKKTLFSTNYYLDQSYSSDIDTEDGTLRFNMSLKNFSIKNHRLTSGFFNKAYLQINEFCFNTLPGVTVSTVRNPNFDGMLGKADVTFQTHSYGQMDLSSALKVEENSKDVRFLYLFKMTTVKEFFFENPFSGKVNKHLFFISAPHKIVVYNYQTREIYKIYSIN